MALMLNITGGNTDSTPKKNVSKNYTQNYSSSGFSFEFTKDEPARAKVLARKRPPKKIDSTESGSSFKLISNHEKTNEQKIHKKPSKIQEKLQEIASNKSIDDIIVSHQAPIKPLGIVEFPDEPASKKNRKNHQKNKQERPVVDFTKQEVVKKDHRSANDRPKKQKSKFSKISNPFPNEPSKKLDIKKHEPKQHKSPKKDIKASNPPSSKVQSENTSVFAAESVDSLNIHKFSIKNLKEVLNFHKLTHVQQKAIPSALEGKDLLIRSATGSGKTLCYALATIEKLQKITPKLTRSQGIHALIIVPTRELCIQTFEVIQKLVKPFTWLVPGYLSGGEKRKTEKARLRNGISILVTTPGRLCDHLIHTESMKLDKVEIFVLDEADRLLELGYENDVKKVVDTIAEHSQKTNKDIQKILLSATLTAKVKELAGLTLDNPVCIDNENSNTVNNTMDIDENIAIPAGIAQTYYIMPERMRFIVLCSLLVQQMSSKDARKILIFFPTQNIVDFNYDILVEFLTQSFTKKARTAKSYLNNDDEDIDEMLEEQEESEDEDDGNVWLPNVTIFKLFGSMTQIERISVFKEFKAVKNGILLCTDVAARGLDVPQLDLVIQYSAPQEFCNYVHRIGRTARAGNKGSAIIFLTRNEDKFIDFLREKKIEIQEDDYTKPLREVQLPNMNLRVYEEKVVTLQRKLEDLLSEDEELRIKASRAFTSWICYYKTFSKELRHLFNMREMHMGHVANNFGLRDAPKSIVKQYAKNEEGKREKNKNFDFTHRVYVPRGDQKSFERLKRKHADFSKANFGKVSSISEFDSGLPELKKRKK